MVAETLETASQGYLPRSAILLGICLLQQFGSRCTVVEYHCQASSNPELGSRVLSINMPYATMLIAQMDMAHALSIGFDVIKPYISPWTKQISSRGL